MKKKLYSIFAILLTVITLIAMMPLTAFADDNLTVNGEAVNKGDIVTYQYYVGGLQEEVGGAGCYISFDTKFLEYVDGSIGFDIFNNAMHNLLAGEGKIYFSAVNAYGYDLSSERMIVTISFKVLDTASGSTTVKCEFDEFFTNDDDPKDFTPDQYTDREVTTVNTYEQNTAPYLGTDAEEMQNYMTSDSFQLEDLFNGVPNENVPDNERSNVSVPSIPEDDSSSTGNTLLIVFIALFCIALAGSVVFVVRKGMFAKAKGKKK